MTSDDCPKCGATMSRSDARLHKGMVRRRCPDCGESDYAWQTLGQLKAKFQDASASQIKAAISSLRLPADGYRGEGDAREYSPDAQIALLGELRRVVSGSKPDRRARRSGT